MVRRTTSPDGQVEQAENIHVLGGLLRKARVLFEQSAQN